MLTWILIAIGTIYALWWAAVILLWLFCATLGAVQLVADGTRALKRRLS